MKTIEMLERKILYTSSIAKVIYGLLKKKSVGRYDNLKHLTHYLNLKV